MDSDIRSLVRQVLSEELAKLRPAANAPTREEAVRIADDRDLDRFVRRILTLSSDGATRRAIEEGRLVFRLSDGPTPSVANSRANSSQPTTASQRIDKGFVSERQIDALPEGTKVLQVSKAVRFTPLGRDRLRQRGIAIERSER